MTTTIDWPVWPQYSDDHVEAVTRVIKSNQLFAASEVRAFEEEFCAYTGAKFAIGLGNATQGLHLALAALNVGAGDEVIVTPYSWISTASCILMQNAIPVFCDIEDQSFGIDPNKVERLITGRTKAIIVVHMFGYPSRILELEVIAKKFGIALIEDASHAHGASVGGKKIGTFGDIAVFSLHQRKSLSVGDGGIITTDREDVARKIARLRSFGDFELSYNYRMSEFAAALGRCGLRRLDSQNSCRRENADHLALKLLPIRHTLRVIQSPADEVAAYFAVLICVDNPVPALDSKLKLLQDSGVPIRKTWPLLHKHPHFNPTSPPARGLPWRDYGYDGQMFDKRYDTLELPVAASFCPDNLLELYVHPPAGRRHMDFVATIMAQWVAE